MVAVEVAREMRGESDWIDQKGSALGRNRHCAAVRRRIGEGMPGASKVGDRYLLSPDALREELESRSFARPKPLVSTSQDAASAETPAPGGVYDRLMSDIRRSRRGT